MASLRNCGLGRELSFRGWSQVTRPIWAVPSALKRFERATRIWISAISVFRGDAFAEGREAPHPGLNPAAGGGIRSGVFGTPCHGGTRGFGPCPCRRAILFSVSAVLADRNDRVGVTVDDGGMAAAWL